jgi:hypothetical protein
MQWAIDNLEASFDLDIDWLQDDSGHGVSVIRLHSSEILISQFVT